MLAWILAKAFIVGLFGALAAGPIFMLVMHRAVSRGAAYGVASALGTALAEGIYFAMALGGLFSIIECNSSMVLFFECVGGVVLLAMGAHALFAGATVKSNSDNAGGGLVWMAFSAGFLTISNPVSILFYVGIATQLFSEHFNHIFPASYLLYAGVAIALGSFLALCVTSVLSSRAGDFFSDRFAHFVSLATGTTFCGIASYLLGNVAVSVFN